MIQRFWSFNEGRSIGSTAISMYLYLLKTGFINDRYDFNISDVAIGRDLGMTRKTVKSTKQKLADLGLIRYKTQNGLPGNYRLILDYPLRRVDDNTGRSIAVKKTTVTKEATKQVQVFPLSAPIKALKSYPSVDEFLEYASTIDNYESRMDPIITDKYKSWISNDWKNSAGRPITNWRSLLKSIMPYVRLSGDINSSVDDIPQIRRPDVL